MAIELAFVSTFERSRGTLKMFTEDVRQSARLRCAAFHLSAQEKTPPCVLSAEEPGGSVNINEDVTKVLATVSHADRHRK